MPHRSHTLIGRDEERLRLAALLDDARRGRGSMVLIEGDAGIGKTALLDDLLARAAEVGFAIHSGKAVELLSRTPFSTLSDGLGLRAARDDARLAELAKSLRGGDEATDAAADALQQLEFRVSEALVAFVEGVALDQPLLLAVDDMHWADAHSLRALLRVAGIVSQLPVLLVMATRPAPPASELDPFLAGLAARRATTLTLRRLTDEAVRTLVEWWTGAPPGPHLLEQLAVAGGNPFFLATLMDMLRDGGGLRVADGVAEIASAVDAPSLPVTILHGLRFASRETLETLSLAAVLGSSFTAAELSILKGSTVADLLPPIREAVRSGILDEAGDALAFRHDLIREALYLDLPVTVRHELHLALARRLSQTGAAAALVAHHLLRGATSGDDEVLDLLQRTGVALLGVAPGLAADALERAVAMAPSQAARDRVLADLAIALLWAGRIDEGESLCREAIAKHLTPTVPTDLRFALARSLSSLGRIAEAVEECDRGVKAPELAAPTRLHLEATGAFMRLLLGDFAGAALTARRILSSAEQSDNLAAAATALSTLALTTRLAGRLGEGLEFAERTAAVAALDGTFDTQQLAPHMVRAGVLLELDRVEEALAAAREGLQAAEAHGAPNLVVLHHLCVARCLHLLGDWDEADAEAETAFRVAEDSGVAWYALALVVRASIALSRNDLLQARDWMKRAEEDRFGAQFAPALFAAAKARIMEADGDVHGALELLRAIWELCVSLGLRAEMPWVAPDLVRLAETAGQTVPGGEICQAVEDLAHENPGVPWLAGVADYCRGVASRDADALLDAVGAYRQSPRRMDLGLACEAAAAALAEAGRTTEAVSLLDEASRLYADLTAVRDGARVDAALRSLGVKRGRRGARRRPASGWEALTDTELAVVRLIVERLSNPEIARRLFISHRTVQTHVSHALGKLGLSSRIELAEAAGRNQGWRLTMQQA